MARQQVRLHDAERAHTAVEAEFPGALEQRLQELLRLQQISPRIPGNSALSDSQDPPPNTARRLSESSAATEKEHVTTNLARVLTVVKPPLWV